MFNIIVFYYYRIKQSGTSGIFYAHINYEISRWLSYKVAKYFKVSFNVMFKRTPTTWEQDAFRAEFNAKK